MHLQTDRFLVVDVETTGTNPALHDPVAIALVPIAAAEDPLLVHVRTPEPRWTDFASVNFRGFVSEWEKDAVAPDAAAARIEEYVAAVAGGQPTTLVGHNVGFDLSFLRKLAALAGKSELTGLSHRTVDTHSLLFCAWLEGKIPEEALSSDGAFRHFGISVDPPLRHTALADALATRTLFLQLIALFDTPAAPIVTESIRLAQLRSVVPHRDRMP